MDFIDCTQVIHDAFSESDPEEEEEDVNKATTREVAVLKYISGPSLQVLNYPLLVGQNIIGRGDTCNVCINNQTLSKQHAMIEIDKKVKSFEIIDLGSSNKTRKGKEKIVLKPNVHYDLVDEEFIRLADLEFQFLIIKSELPKVEADDSDTASESMFVEDTLESETSLMLESNLDDLKTKSETNLEIKQEKNPILASFTDGEESFNKNTLTDMQPAIEETPAPSKTVSNLFIAESDKDTDDDDTDIEDNGIISGKEEGNNPTRTESISQVNSFPSPNLPQIKMSEKVEQKIDQTGNGEKFDTSIYEADTQPYESFLATQPYIPTQVQTDENTIKKPDALLSNDDSAKELETKTDDMNAEHALEIASSDNEKVGNAPFMEYNSETEQVMATQLYVPSDDDDDNDENSENPTELKENDLDKSGTEFLATQLYVPSPEPTDLSDNEPKCDSETIIDKNENVAVNKEQEDTLVATQPYEPSQQIDSISLCELETLPYSLCVSSDTISLALLETRESQKLKESNDNSGTNLDNKRSLHIQRTDHAKINNDKPEKSTSASSNADLQADHSSISGYNDKAVSDPLKISQESTDKLSENKRSAVLCMDVLENSSTELKDQGSEERIDGVSEVMPEKLVPETVPQTLKKLPIVTGLKKNKKATESQADKETGLTTTEIAMTDAKEYHANEMSKETRKSSRTRLKQSKQQDQSLSEKKVKHANSEKSTLDKSPVIRGKLSRDKKEGVETQLPVSAAVVSSPVLGRRWPSRLLNEATNNAENDSNDSSDEKLWSLKGINKGSSNRKLLTKVNENQQEKESGEINEESGDKFTSLSKPVIPKTSRRGRKTKNEIPVENVEDLRTVDLVNKKNKNINQNTSMQSSKEKTIETHSKDLSDNGSLKVDPLVLVVNKSAPGSPTPYIIQKPQTRKRTSKTLNEDSSSPLVNIEPIPKKILENTVTVLSKQSQRTYSSPRVNRVRKTNERNSDPSLANNDKKTLPTLNSSLKGRRSKQNVTLENNNISAVLEKSDNENMDFEDSHPTLRRSRRNTKKAADNANNSIAGTLRTSTPRRNSSTSSTLTKPKGKARGKGQLSKSETSKLDTSAKEVEVTPEIEIVRNIRGRGRRMTSSEQVNAKISSNQSNKESISNPKEQTLSLRQYRKKYNSKDLSSSTLDNIDQDKNLKTNLLAANEKINDDDTVQQEESILNEIISYPTSRRKRTITPSAKYPQPKRSPISSVQKTEESEVENQDIDLNAVPETPKRGRGKRKVSTLGSSIQESTATVTEESPNAFSTESKRRGRNSRSSLSPSTPATPRASRRDKTRKDFHILNDVNGSVRFVDICANAVNPKVMFTGVADEKAEKIIKELGGKITSSVNDCTHLITDKVRRTFKFLCHLARGKPIVSIDWVRQCSKALKFVDASKFLVKDTASEKQYGFNLRNSLEKACERPLLEGFSIHVTSGVKPEPSQMKMIIECAGGEYLTRMPASNVANRKTIVVSCTEDLRNCSRALAGSVPVVSAEFILMGILKQSDNIESYCLIT